MRMTRSLATWMTRKSQNLRKCRTSHWSEIHAERLETRSLLSAGAISGVIFEDLNGDGDQDSGEMPMSGATVFLDANDNGELDLVRTNILAESVPVTIEDLSFAEVPISVSGLDGVIADINVTINIQHTFIGDLDATLISPNGTQVKLFSRVGDGAEEFTNTTFDDDAVRAIQTSEPPFDGSFRPEFPLSKFNGELPNGTWTLRVRDLAAVDTGSINDVTLEIAVTGGDSERFAITDDKGNYRFDDLVSAVNVTQMVPRGYDQTHPETSSYLATPVPDEVTSGFDFGNHPLPGTIRGQKWHDFDGDGIHSSNEPGLNDWTIELIDAVSMEVVRSVSTISVDLDDDDSIDPVTESGLYEFGDLVPGRYIVREVAQAGWAITTPAADNSVVGDEPVTQEGTFTVTTPPTGTPESPAQWLPDLIIDMQNASGLRNAFIEGTTLRFGQATPNVGHGAMHLVGGADNGDGTQSVMQRIYDDQGGFTDQQAGNFLFHPEHNHIHFDGFARYALRTTLQDTNDDGVPEVGEIVRGGNKTSFCLVNVTTYSTETPLPNAAPDRGDYGCDTEQEISVGWEDIYGAGTEGQEINIAGLAPGDYWLEAVVDPDNHFVELDESNNTGRILVHIGPADRSYSVRVLPGAVIEGKDFGNVELGSISGVVKRDANGNGLLSVIENVGVSHVAVYLDLNGDHVLNNPTSGNGVADGLALEPWTLTDDDGRFVFEEIHPGELQVRIVAPAGSVQTTETPVPAIISSGNNVTGLQFGVGTPFRSTTRVAFQSGNFRVADITASGKVDRLDVTFVSSGFLPAPVVLAQQLTPGVSYFRIHDPVNVLTTSIGIQEGLHTIIVPLDESLPINEQGPNPKIVVDVGGGNDIVRVDMAAISIDVILNGGTGHDRLELITSSGIIPFAETIKDSRLMHDHSDDYDDLAVAREFPFAASNGSLNGGTGNDTLISGSGSDTLSGEVGNDSLSSGAGNDRLNGGIGDDKLDGGADDDSLFGGNGKDLLCGQGGDDSLDGDLGNDTLLGGDGNDVMNGGRDQDKLLGMSGDDRLNGGNDDDTISGGEGNDQLNGSNGRDVLLGDEGDDVLVGGNDRDLLFDSFGLNTFPGSTSNERISPLRSDLVAVYVNDLRRLLELCSAPPAAP